MKDVTSISGLSVSSSCKIENPASNDASFVPFNTSLSPILVSVSLAVVCVSSSTLKPASVALPSVPSRRTLSPTPTSFY